MKRWGAYALASALLVAIASAFAWRLLDHSGRAAWLWASGSALVVQWGAFGLMVGLRSRPQGVLLGMAGGTIARFAALGAAGVVITVTDRALSASVLILALAGFLFVLALLEGFFVRDLNGSNTTT